MEFVRSTPGSDPIVVEGHFAVPPHRVFKAWTEPDMVMQWFGLSANSLHSASIDLREGGAWQFIKSLDDEKSVGFEGEYIAITQDELLVFSWSLVVKYANGKREATPPSQVKITFLKNNTGTDVKLIHSSIHTEETCKGFGRGWEIAFGSLVKLL